MLIFALATTSVAQNTGTVEYEDLGIKFQIPFGWIGQETEGGFFIGSNTQPGFIMLSAHKYTELDELKKEARAGIDDGVSTKLKLNSAIQKVGESGVGAEYEGVLEGQSVKAFVVGLINSHGTGVTIIAATAPDKYSTEYERLVLQTAKSVKFYTAKTPLAVEQWQRVLKNSRLTYMNSYSSSNSGSYGGYSDKSEIHLCDTGYFRSNNQSSMSIDAGGGSAYSDDRKKGHGSWKVVASGDGAALVLEYRMGTYEQYKLEDRSGQTFLNGTRYFRTYGTAGQDDGPRC